ncbi:MAG: hypothetical protein Q4D34_04305 [Eggerthellaceae bacterium]|nr:hypothetical protein [Eggerthellaceae bacterium]
MDSQEPVIETIVATVAEIDPNDLIVGYNPDDGDNSGRSTFAKVVDAGTVASHVVALGATKVADVAAPAIAKGVEIAAPVLERGAKKTAKGAVKLTTIGLQSLGKGLTTLGGKLKGPDQIVEETQYVTVCEQATLDEAEEPALEGATEVLMLEETTEEADTATETPAQE